MPRYKLINGTRVQFTAEEEALRDAEELEWSNGAFDRSMENLRTKRNSLLAETDWTQFTDSPLTAEKKYSFADYRQQLRDITNGLTTVADVEAVVFPTKPEV